MLTRPATPRIGSRRQRAARGGAEGLSRERCFRPSCASSASIVGLPAGPFIAGGAALAFLACFFAGGMNLRGAAADQNVKLRQKLNDNASFREGH